MSSEGSTDTPFVDAEAWLAARGVRREPIRVDPEPAPAPAPDAGADAGTTRPEDAGPPGVSADAEDTAGVSAREAGRLAQQAVADAALREQDAAALPDPAAGSLEGDVAAALAFVRSSTSAVPQSEGRLRGKLADRDWPTAVIDAAMERARRERLVDDPAMAAALVAERRAKGHAPARIRRDLRDRGFDEPTLDVALGGAEHEDQEAAAFAVAREKAERLGAVAAETAFRRVVGHVARRGYAESLARKVAREAVFTARDEQRTAGH